MTAPKTLWRAQPSESPDVRFDILQADVDAELGRIRRARVLLVLSTLAGMVLTAHQAVLASTPLVRLGEGLMAAGFLLVLILAWRRLARTAPDTAETCLAFLRQSLIRRRQAALGGWVVLVAPLLPGLWVTFIGLAEASGSHWERLLPIVALLIAWLAIALLLQAREAAKVAVEIARLDALGGGL
uniref:hypothetical protein n=1 Tax=uncultured Caulobacter sp. TaxID=158749 RepID=UPI0025D02FB7|nr:hypothetical protein [uncultured Caulobacter sp.]